MSAGYRTSFQTLYDETFFKIYLFIYLFMEVNKEITSDSMKKCRKKQNIPKFFMKADVKNFGCNNLLQDFKFIKSVVKITMDV